MRYEYKVIPAPARGEKRNGAKTAEARFAASVEHVMNDMAARGWEYQRTDTLPSEERTGLTQTQTVWRNLLVFRRGAAEDVGQFQPRMLEAPAKAAAPANMDARPAAGSGTTGSGTTGSGAAPASQPAAAPASQPAAHPAAQPAAEMPAPKPLPDALKARAARLREQG